MYAGRQFASPIGIDQQFESVDSGAAQNFDHHLDHFRVDHGRFRADRFCADLDKLAETAFLRTFAAEHGADVVDTS